MNKFKVHKPKKAITLLSVGQRVGETLWNFLTGFNAATAIVHKPDLLIVLMPVVFGVVSKNNFKVSLERDPLVNLGDFYYQARRYPH